MTTYFWVAALVTFVCLIAVPTELRVRDNLLVSAVVAATLGWLVWPFALFAIYTSWMSPQPPTQTPTKF